MEDQRPWSTSVRGRDTVICEVVDFDCGRVLSAYIRGAIVTSFFNSSEREKKTSQIEALWREAVKLGGIRGRGAKSEGRVEVFAVPSWSMPRTSALPRPLNQCNAASSGKKQEGRIRRSRTREMRKDWDIRGARKGVVE